VLPPGRYAAHNLLGGPDGAPLEVRSDGRITGYIPMAMLGPREFLVLNLVRRHGGEERGRRYRSSTSSP